MKRKWTAAVTLLLAVLLLAACGIAEEVKPDVTLIGAHVNSDDSSFNIGMVAFADKLKEISGGKMVMEEHSSENVQAVWAALGAQPTSLAYNELYSGLQNKVIDAAENDLGNILLQKFYEAGPYIALSQHDIATRMIVISKSRYNRLTDEQKAWVDQAAAESRETQWNYDMQLSDTAMADIEAAGRTFIEVEDREKWIETASPIIESVAEKLGVGDQYRALKALQ